MNKHNKIKIKMNYLLVPIIIKYNFSIVNLAYVFYAKYNQ